MAPRERERAKTRRLAEDLRSLRSFLFSQRLLFFLHSPVKSPDTHATHHLLPREPESVEGSSSHSFLSLASCAESGFPPSLSFFQTVCLLACEGSRLPLSYHERDGLISLAWQNGSVRTQHLRLPLSPSRPSLPQAGSLCTIHRWFRSSLSLFLSFFSPSPSLCLCRSC